MKFLESYKKVLNNTRILAKISTFLIAIFLLVEIFGNLYSYIFYHPQFLIDQFWNQILISMTFQLIIVTIFVSRFVLLWLDKSKFLWLSQITWVAGWLSILTYLLITNKILIGSFFGSRKFICMDCFYYDTFLLASASLTVILLVYLCLSPIKQILILIFALETKKLKKT